MRRCAACAMLALLAVAVGAGTVSAQAPSPRVLTLEEAIRIGSGASENVGIARAGVNRALGQRQQARSEMYPQLTGSAAYVRTLASQFSPLADTTSGPPAPECRKFTANPDLPVEERVDSLEAALECQTRQNPFAAFSDLPFGRENQYSFGLAASQLLFAGGRVRAQGRVADAGVRLARIGLESAEALVTLAVTEAYYDAVLSDRLASIAESTLVQAERTFENTRLAEQVGNVAEFDRLRAEVLRNNARPAVIRRRAQRDVALLRLKQLLELPLQDSLELATPLGDAAAVTELPPPALSSVADTSVSARIVVRQAAENVNVQEGRLAIARAQTFPTLRLSSQYLRLAYPDNLVPAWSDFVSDWTVTLGLSVPLFTGGRLAGERAVANADVDEARLRLKQTREFAELDVRSTAAQLEAAAASWAASAGVVGQAQRAYEIAEIRYREGISTQTELGDSRVQLQQALANRAQSARDLQVARVRWVLIADLPAATVTQ